MRKVILHFPDVACLSDFVLTCKVCKSEINSLEKTLVGLLTEKQVFIAVKQYGAKVKTSVLVRS